MKKILCFGDSNTFGFNPENGQRFPKGIRWSGILQFLCSKNTRIIEAGCNNRTGFCQSPDGEFYTGYLILPKYLEENPDVIILAVGINDLQYRYNVTESEIADGLQNLIDICYEKCPDTKIILLIPPLITESVLGSTFSCMFDSSSIEKSKILPKIYQRIADKNECLIIDMNSIVKVSDIDGLHYDKNSHKIIAETIHHILNF